MAKRSDAVLSGEEMLEIYYKNKKDKSLDNRENLRRLVAYMSELVAEGIITDTEALEFCTDKLYDMEEHKEPDKRKLFMKFNMAGVVVTGVIGASLIAAVVCSAFGIDFIFNIFTREGETTILNVAEQYSSETVETDETSGSEIDSETGEDGDETEISGGSIATVDELIEICEPGWLPDGYELVETVLDNDNEYSRGHMLYENDMQEKINVSVYEKKDGSSYYAYNDSEYYERYEYCSIIYEIYSDNGHLNVVWQSDGYVFDVMAENIGLDLLKKIVNSYYEENE